MSNEIKSKFSAGTALAITLADLASSTTGAGRQSSMVDNSATRFAIVHLFLKVALGNSPSANKTVQVYLLKGDAAGLRTDGAAAGDGALGVKNAPLIGVMTTGASPGAGDALQKHFTIRDPGPEWGIAVVHDTGANLNGTPANHAVHYVGDNAEIQ